MTPADTPRSEPIRVELFVQQHAPADVVESLRALVARVRRLEDDSGPVTDVSVKTWSPVRPALEELSDSGASVSLTVTAFQSWAEVEGYSLGPAFERREVTTMLDRRPVGEIRVPIACLAVYEDDDLRCVAPCTDGSDTYTVEECLTALESGLTEPFADAGGGESGSTRPEFASAPESDGTN